MGKAHYTAKDFIIIYTTDLGEYGYCAKCTADIQRFYSDGLLHHYHSHRYYRAARFLKRGDKDD